MSIDGVCHFNNKKKFQEFLGQLSDSLKFVCKVWYTCLSVKQVFIVHCSSLIKDNLYVEFKKDIISSHHVQSL